MNSQDIPGTVEYVKDFMPLTYQNEIITNLRNMPWYWRPQIAEYSPEIYVDKANPFEDPRVTDAFAFVHVCYEDGNVKSEFYQYFKPILRFLEFKLNIQITELIRLRLRLSSQIPNHTLNHYNPPHVDLMSTDPFKTFVYYVDDSDGDTVIFNKRYESTTQPTTLTKNEPDLKPIFTSTPRKGEGVYFDGLQYHAGNSPVNYKSRCIINFDFKIAE
jgi:hypothetical protein